MCRTENDKQAMYMMMGVPTASEANNAAANQTGRAGEKPMRREREASSNLRLVHAWAMSIHTLFRRFWVSNRPGICFVPS